MKTSAFTVFILAALLVASWSLADINLQAALHNNAHQYNAEQYNAEQYNAEQFHLCLDKPGQNFMVQVAQPGSYSASDKRYAQTT